MVFSYVDDIEKRKSDNTHRLRNQLMDGHFLQRVDDDDDDEVPHFFWFCKMLQKGSFYKFVYKFEIFWQSHTGCVSVREIADSGNVEGFYVSVNHNGCVCVPLRDL